MLSGPSAVHRSGVDARLLGKIAGEVARVDHHTASDSRNAELNDYWLRGEFQPYTTEDLLDLIVDIKPTIPRYCRVNRVIRDIPAHFTQINKAEIAWTKRVLEAARGGAYRTGSAELA